MSSEVLAIDCIFTDFGVDSLSRFPHRIRTQTHKLTDPTASRLTPRLYTAGMNKISRQRFTYNATRVYQYETRI